MAAKEEQVNRALRLVLLLAGVLLLLTLAIFLLADKKAPEKTQASEYDLTGHTAEQLVSIRIRNEYADFTVTCAENGYTIDAAENLPLDANKLAAFMRRVAVLKAYTCVEEHANDLSAYHLDKPSARADWSFADGRAASVEFGMSIAYGTYAKAAGNDAVYLLSNAQMSDFKWEPRSFVSTQVTRNFVGSLFDRVIFSGEMRPAGIVVVPNPDRGLSGVDYRMVQPKEKPTAKAAKTSAQKTTKADNPAESTPKKRGRKPSDN